MADRCAAGRELIRGDCDWGVPCPHVATVLVFIDGDADTPPAQVGVCAWHEGLLEHELGESFRSITIL